MENRDRGLFGKFFVCRADGRDKPGQKHFGSEYFVLDMTGDPHAYRALRAYAASCSSEFPVLSADLTEKANNMRCRGVIPSERSIEALQRLIAQGNAFVDFGHEEDEWEKHQDLACPYCGGSGHKEDVRGFTGLEPTDTSAKDQ